MALSPEDVLNKTFTTTQFRRGYDEREVDDFLGAQGAAGRQWGSVTVQIDKHALEFDAVQQ